MEGQPVTGLPASIEAAWGRRERPSKGPKPMLTLQRIVDAAVGIARAETLAAVSMARVAQELDVSTMSLYRYVAAKEELVALMVDSALGSPPSRDGGEGWRAGLARWAWGHHRALRQNTWALRVPIGGPPTTPNLVAWLEDGLYALRETGLAEAEKASVVLLLSGYVRSEASLTADLAAADPTMGAIMAGYADLLAGVTDAARFPALHAVLDAGVFDAADDPDEEFAFGLERILDGVAVLVDSRS
jgi:AcrR family transcriptional regulator